MIEDSYPLSPLQQGMLFHSLYAPGSGVDIEQVVCDLHEDLDVAAFERAWQRVIQRHPALRTAFQWQELGEPRQVVHGGVECPVERQDWRSLAGAERDARYEDFLMADRLQGLDLSRAPVMRLTLLQYAESDYRFVWTFHHALLDGRSFILILKEVFAFYEAFSEGGDLDLERPRPLRDYIEWLQRQDWLQSQGFWQQLLQDYVSPISLAVDRLASGRPAGEKGYGAQRIQLSYRLPADLTQALQSFAWQHRLTPNTLVQGAWACLLSRHSGNPDVVFGATRACRHSPLDGLGTGSIIGFMMNTLPVRARVLPDVSAIEFLRELRTQALAVRPHEHTPLAQVQEWSQVPRGTALFEHLLVYEDYLLNDALQSFGGKWKNRECSILAHPNYPLTCVAYGSMPMLLRLRFDAQRFDPPAVQRMFGHMQTLLQGLIADPERRLADVPILPEAERRQLLVEWNDTHADDVPGQLVHQLFESQVSRTPTAVAAVCQGRRMSYEELNRCANRLAQHLQRLGVGPETIVGICVERSLEMMVGLLGILKAGGAYLPLDPAYPVERMAFMLDDARARILLTEKRWAGRLASADRTILCLDDIREALSSSDADNPTGSVALENLAYVIYTSGSTGKPKGVMISHRGLVNYLSWCTRAYAVAEGQGAPVHSSISFDLTITGLFSPLLAGRSVTLVPEEEGYEGLGAALARGGDYSLVKITPAHLEILSQQLEQDQVAGRTRRFIIGGEGLRGEVLSFWQTRAPGTRLVNEYGPTETVVGCCVYEAPGAAPIPGLVPIGRPIANTRLYVLDEHMHPVPIGVPGELYIGGDGVARGYLNRPDLTAERFVPDPYSLVPGARLYRTGDVARYMADGNLECLGRIDRQVKIRGYRVELEEIEAVLGQHRAVREVAVALQEPAPGQKRVVAFLVPRPGRTVEARDLSEFLRAKLPEYMLPSSYVLLETMPLTPNGKIDRSRLPAPDAARSELEKDYVAPRNRVEQFLADIWAAVLGLERVGVEDNFFELGGDSILSFQIMARANRAGIQITPRQLFEHPTIAEISAQVGTAMDVRAEQGPVTGPVPLTPIQHWFFEQSLPDPQHWNIAFLLQADRRLDPALTARAAEHLIEHHDALRLSFIQEPSWDGQAGETRWRQVNGRSGRVPLTCHDLSALSAAEQKAAMKATAAKLQGSLDLLGPLLRLALFDLGHEQPSRVLVIIHHLAVDGVSWRILLEDFQTAYQQLERGLAVQLPRKTTSFKEWAERLVEYAQSPVLKQESRYWLGTAWRQAPKLPLDFPENASANPQGAARTVSVSLSREETRALLQEIPTVYRTMINDVLLAALGGAFARWTGAQHLLLDLEGHGREELEPGVDLSRTVGWFTTIFPVLLDLAEIERPDAALKSVKEQLRRIPNKGIGYGLLRYLCQDKSVIDKTSWPQAEVSFNYLGQFDQALSTTTIFRRAERANGPARSPRGRRAHLLEVSGIVVDGHLQMNWTYGEHIHRRETIERLAADFLDALRGIIVHCQSPQAGGFTPSDFPEAELNQEELDDLMRTLEAE